MRTASVRATSTDEFYARLPVLTDFADVARPEVYTDLPEDWQVIVTDVEHSTVAVRAGRYKDVNLLGASSIIAVLNAVRPLQIPFVFGGDGASMCIPAGAIEAARAALLATTQVADRRFRMRLRAGIVPVSFIRGAGFRVTVARHRVSEHYAQAAFSGGGLQFAERCIKDPERGQPFRLAAAAERVSGDFTGLECRWDNIKSARGEIVTLLVQALGDSVADQGRIYCDTLGSIAAIYGSPAAAHPVLEDQLHLTTEDAKLRGEALLRGSRLGRIGVALYRLSMRLQVVVGGILMERGGRLLGIDWGRYKKDLVANTDFRKFDDLLRHVLSGTPDQRRRLVEHLEPMYRRGQLAYGMHVAPAALMTCLIFKRDGGHVHFVDGADGGYTLASADLKSRLKATPPRSPAPSPA